MSRYLAYLRTDEGIRDRGEPEQEDEGLDEDEDKNDMIREIDDFPVLYASVPHGSFRFEQVPLSAPYVPALPTAQQLPYEIEIIYFDLLKE